MSDSPLQSRSALCCWLYHSLLLCVSLSLSHTDIVYLIHTVIDAKKKGSNQKRSEYRDMEKVNGV